MTKATSTTTTAALATKSAPPAPSRRQLLVGSTFGAMLLLAAAEAGSAKAAELDGELIALCGEFGRASHLLAEAEADDAVSADDIGPLCHHRERLLAEIASIPSRTPEGLRRKAEVTRASLLVDVPSEQPRGTWDGVAAPHDRLAMSLCRDLLGRAGA